MIVEKNGCQCKRIAENGLYIPWIRRIMSWPGTQDFHHDRRNATRRT